MGRPDGPPKGGAYPPGGFYQANQPRGPQFQGMDQAGHEREERPPYAPAGAEGGAEPGQDVEDGYRYRRTEVRESSHFYQRSTSTVDEVTEQAPSLVSAFIVDRMHRDGLRVPPDLDAQVAQNRHREVGQCLQRIGDELSNNRDLNRLIDSVQVSSGTAFDTFAAVAGKVFDDGIINWGRIVTLFYFGYRLALQCVTEYRLIQTIIDWVCRFIVGRIARWISERGGWSAVKEYFGSTSVQMVGVFVAGFLVSCLVRYWRKS